MRVDVWGRSIDGSGEAHTILMEKKRLLAEIIIFICLLKIGNWFVDLILNSN